MHHEPGWSPSSAPRRAGTTIHCVGIACLCLFGASCTSDSVREEAAEALDIPARFTASSPSLHSKSLSPDGWLKDFKAPGLSTLVKEAIAKNHDLKSAAARMKAAKARSVLEGANRWPQLGGSFDASHTKRRSTNNANSGTSTQTNSSAAESQSSGPNLSFEDYDLGLNLSWEIDLWGRLRDTQRAAVLDYQAAAGDYYAARLSLAANTAKAWFNAIEAALQHQLAEETHESFKRNLEVVEAAFDRGIQDDAGGDNALDVRLARANVAGARARIAETRRSLDTAARTLEVLLGRYPAEQIPVSKSFPSLRRSVPVGLPSELLLRRPDILAAEYRLAAGGARVLASKKAFLPTIRITGSKVSRTEKFEDLLSWESIVSNIAGGVTQPIFEGGRLAAELGISKADREEALHLYAQTALNAFQEVESTLASERYLAERESALNLAAKESIEAEKIALKQYDRGLVDIITVLEAQRRSFDSRSTRIMVSNLRLQNRIDLYLALGGDFDSLLDADIFPPNPEQPNEARARKKSRSTLKARR